ncbi:MAG: FtsW/RodA/SpoVE family cell cycle protein [bacterium]|nr:FtsW/RodA/SpoVE family cell cycle protein [bacterium]MDD6832234.1 FtsW/RodA/SpoVE family cell cycle protein [bacterium]
MSNNKSHISEKAHRYEEMTRKHGDPWIWGIYIMLIVISLVETYSAASREVVKMGVYMPILKHILFLMIGGGLLLATYRIPYTNKKYLIFYTVGLTAISILLLIYVLFFGENYNNAQRSFRVLGISVQPFEIAKLAVVLCLSLVLSRTQKGNGVSNNGVIVCVLLIAVYGLLTYVNGMTNFLLLTSISLVMMVVGGITFKRIAILLVAFGLVGGAIYMIKSSNDDKDENLQKSRSQTEQVMQEGETGDLVAEQASKKGKKKVDRSNVRKKRIENWLNNDSLWTRPIIPNENDQEMFAYMAQAHGGVTGVFFGNSRETSRLPLASSDYVFSIIVEDTGLIGGVIVLTLFLALLLRAAMIARRCRRTLPTLMVIGLASMITLQALFHIAINTGVFPVSGQPLPLISKGGSAIVVTSYAFALLLSISRTVAGLTDKENATKEEMALPEELRAENPSQLINYKNVWK